MSFISRLLDMPSSDPDDARRRRLLNFILFIVALLTLFTFFFTVYLDLSGVEEDAEDISSLYSASGALLIGIVIIFLINRYGAGWLASLLFLLLFTFVMVFTSDAQLILGEYMFYLTMPILMASVLVRPWASYVMASLNTLIIARAAVAVQEVLPLPGVLGFFLLALVSWLAARTMEQALHDLRTLNAELDQRVQDRTRELADANERLQELDRLKSRFVSIVSHELRTPLSAIYGFAEMLQAEVYGTLSDKQYNAVDRIIANDQRMLGMVNDLLDQARIEAGQLSLSIAPFLVRDLVNDMESTMRVIAESKGHYLRTHIAPDVPKVLQGDIKRLHQILVNLINNALKFTKQGGVDVCFYCPDSRCWAIDVSDTGPGIPVDAQEAIFEPFLQLDNSTTREYKGFGLGLAIVRQLATLMGGTADVQSELGQGSTFTITLPIVRPQEIGE